MAGGALDFHFFTRAQPRGRGVAVKGAVRWLDSGVGSLAGVTPCPSVSISPALLQALNLDPMEVAKAKNGLPPFESQTDPAWVTSLGDFSAPSLRHQVSVPGGRADQTRVWGRDVALSAPSWYPRLPAPLYPWCGSLWKAPGSGCAGSTLNCQQGLGLRPPWPRGSICLGYNPDQRVKEVCS